MRQLKFEVRKAEGRKIYRMSRLSGTADEPDKKRTHHICSNQRYSSRNIMRGLTNLQKKKKNKKVEMTHCTIPQYQKRKELGKGKERSP